MTAPNNDPMTIATARAAKFVADWKAGDEDTCGRLLCEVGAAGQFDVFAIALAARCVDLASELYGERTQVELDGFALDAGSLEECDTDE